MQKTYLDNLRKVTEDKLEIGSLVRTVISIEEGLVFNVIKSIKCVKLYSTFYISHTIRTNGFLYLTGHNECPLLTILLT